MAQVAWAIARRAVRLSQATRPVNGVHVALAALVIQAAQSARVAHSWRWPKVFHQLADRFGTLTLARLC